MPQTTPFLIFIKQAVVQEGNFCGLKDFVPVVSWWLRAQGVKPLMGHTNYIGVDYFSGKCFRKRGSTFQKYFQVSIHTYGRHRWFKGLFWISLFVGPTPQPASVDVLWLYCTGARKGVVPFMDAWKRARHCLLWWECHSDEPALELYTTGQIPSRKNNHGP